MTSEGNAGVVARVLAAYATGCRAWPEPRAAHQSRRSFRRRRFCAVSDRRSSCGEAGYARPQAIGFRHGPDDELALQRIAAAARRGQPDLLAAPGSACASLSRPSLGNRFSATLPTPALSTRPSLPCGDSSPFHWFSCTTPTAAVALMIVSDAAWGTLPWSRSNHLSTLGVAVLPWAPVRNSARHSRRAIPLGAAGSIALCSVVGGHKT